MTPALSIRAYARMASGMGLSMTEMVVTATGPIAAADVGFTLTHEHLFFDTTAWLAEPRDERKAKIATEPVSVDILEDLRRDPVISRDNLTFGDGDADEQIIVAELQR